MYKRLITRLFLISALIAAIFSCAKISTPSGGPRDRKPPVVVESKPLNRAKNFRGKKIEILFDEYVVLDNINDKFMVSPPMKKKPRVFIRGKSVNVEFDEKLKDSTTYTFYFLDAIKDLNEGNILQNYQFVFSTGPVIDSLSVTGNIFNADNLEIPEKTEAIMYRELEDSAVEKHLPEYISRVNAVGYFRIDNLRPGNYRLFGLKDDDNSKNYNLPDEGFAFRDSTITITSEKNYIPPPVIKDTIAEIVKKVKKVVSKKPGAVKDTTTVKKKPLVPPEPEAMKGEYDLYLFTAKRKNHYLTSSRREQRYLLTYILSLPPDTMKFDFSIPDADPKTYFMEPNRSRDTLRVWLTDSTVYSRNIISTIIRYPFTDSLKKLIYKEDTVKMSFAAPRVSKNAKVKKKVFTLDNNISTGYLKPGGTILFKSKTPFVPPDTSHIRLYELVASSDKKPAESKPAEIKPADKPADNRPANKRPSDKKPIDKKTVPYTLIRDSLSSTKYYLNAKLSQEKKYLFVADSGAFSNIFKEVSDSIGIKFSIKAPETYSKITMEIKNCDGNDIIQLLDKSEKLVAQTFIKKDGKVVFPLLETGFYRLRVIYDLNGDGKWTTGDFTVHRQPEAVSYYPVEIELKPGWDLEFVNDHAWDIGVRNVKDWKLVEKKKTK